MRLHRATASDLNQAFGDPSPLNFCGRFVVEEGLSTTNITQVKAKTKGKTSLRKGKSGTISAILFAFDTMSSIQTIAWHLTRFQNAKQPKTKSP
jgi:hypothetical protein